MDIGTNIYTLRKEKKITQANLLKNSEYRNRLFQNGRTINALLM